MTATTSTSNRCLRWLSCTAVFALLVLHAPITFALDWHIEEVDTTGNVGQHCSLALDADGYPHISYYHETNEMDLKYAHWDGSSWQIEVVDSSWITSHTSLALDVDGYPHVSYQRLRMLSPSCWSCELWHAYQDGSGWHREFIDGWGGGQFEWGHVTSSLSLDVNGHSHIGYCLVRRMQGIYIESSLRYAYEGVSGWGIEVVNDTEDAAFLTPSMALAADEWPHMSYVKDDTLMYVYKDLSGWQFEVVDTGGSEPSLALDGDGYPHISYIHSEDRVWYAYKNGSGWNHEQAYGHPGRTYHGPSLVLDEDVWPHIAASWEPDIGQASGLDYSLKDGSGWHQYVVEYLPVAEAEEADPSLALDLNDIPRISYYCSENLKYARPIILLSGTVQAGQFVLTWSEWPWAWAYRVHGEENQAYFDPTTDNLKAHLQEQTWWSPDGIGDPNSNWTYVVVGLVMDGENELSNYFGEHDFLTEIPKHLTGVGCLFLPHPATMPLSSSGRGR